MSKLSILLVDDERSILKALKRTLFEYPYEIMTASSSLEAKEYLACNSIDMIISDYKMPEENGITLLSYVRDRYPEIIRIMLSGYVDKEVILESLFSCAALTIFPKPWDDEKLIKRISGLFKMKKGIKDSHLWVLINSGALFEINSTFQEVIRSFNLKSGVSNHLLKIIADDMFLLFRIARMVYSDYFNNNSPFNLADAVNLIGLNNIIKLSANSPKFNIPEISVYSIMQDIFSLYYDPVCREFCKINENIGEDIPLPFIYIYNFILFQVDRDMYNKRIRSLISDGTALKSSDTVGNIYKTAIAFYGLPKEFLEYCDRAETDVSAKVLAARKLRDLVEIFWWSESMPKEHPLYTLPESLLKSIYKDVRKFKRLQL